MRNITLVFPDEKWLWAFVQTLQSKPLAINSNDKKLTCKCTDAEITKALIEFKAEIVEEVEERS